MGRGKEVALSTLAHGSQVLPLFQTLPLLTPTPHPSTSAQTILLERADVTKRQLLKAHEPWG